MIRYLTKELFELRCIKFSMFGTFSSNAKRQCLLIKCENYISKDYESRNYKIQVKVEQ